MDDDDDDDDDDRQRATTMTTMTIRRGLTHARSTRAGSRLYQEWRDSPYVAQLLAARELVAYTQSPDDDDDGEGEGDGVQELKTRVSRTSSTKRQMAR